MAVACVAGNIPSYVQGTQYWMQQNPADIHAAYRNATIREPTSEFLDHIS